MLEQLRCTGWSHWEAGKQHRGGRGARREAAQGWGRLPRLRAVGEAKGQDEAGEGSCSLAAG